ncbi:MAG TPA: hypothetical protein VLV54_02200 [Thermoanaerobaculia bacterium]|nr:hypothetical protein [Thermoanaerobaculia bacterium]
MKRHLALMLTLMVLGTVPLTAQRPAQRGPAQRGPEQHPHMRANQGHLPPPPSARRGPSPEPEVERFDGGRMNGIPHVNHDHWFGHDRPGDPRFHQPRAFEHGRFAHVGPAFRYGVSRFDRAHRRFWLGGAVFEVAAWDWPLALDWCWDCGDDFVVYEDPDHPGWYLLYNLETGGYVHVQYFGG